MTKMLWQVGYNVFGVPISHIFFWVLALFQKKVRRGLVDRRGIWSRLELQAAKARGKTTLWIHVSSAGEYLQARPVIEKIKQARPDLIIMLTLFSPTGYDWVKREKQPPDIFEYLPSDSASSIRHMLDLFQPKVLVLVKFDLWPNLVWQTSNRNIPIILISGTLNPSSLRVRSKIIRSFFRTLYGSLRQILTVGTEDSRLYQDLMKEHKAIHSIGDTRVDSVLNRQNQEKVKPLSPVSQKIKDSGRLTLIVGSSWPNDERIVLGAWIECLKDSSLSVSPKPLLVIVPHEPSPHHLGELSHKLDSLNLSWTTYSQMEIAGSADSPNSALSADVLLVDRVGILAGLYRIGQFAFVGSGHGGVHNTMEPAAWNLPIAFGPRYDNAPEAKAFIALGGALSVSNSLELSEHLKKWLKEPDKAVGWGQTNRAYLESHSGASTRCTEIILEEIGDGSI